jgi:Tol biopolymer transport system component
VLRSTSTGLKSFLFALALSPSLGLPAAAVLASDSASGPSSAPSLSADGRFLVFLSAAPDLVPGQIDRNDGDDVFLYDRGTGKTVLVSHAAGSEVMAGDQPVTLPGNPQGLPPQISPDGRYVAFLSTAGNLVTGQRDSLYPAPDLFLYDRETRRTTLVTHKKGSPLTASAGPPPFEIRLASDGSIAFSSSASDLMEHGTDTNFSNDVFFWDRRFGKTTLISHVASSSGRAARGTSGGPWPSADGRYIAFHSDARDLVPGPPLPPTTTVNVFLHDRATGRTALVSHASSSPSRPGNGASGNPVISAAGAWVVFASSSTNLVPGERDDFPLYFDVYLYERATGRIVLVSHASTSSATTGDGVSDAYRITPDGNWVAFASRAGNLVAGQTEGPGHSRDVFLFERATGQIRLASRAAASPVTGAGQDCLEFDLSADGRWVAFTTSADDLVAGGADANHAVDVFLFDRLAGTVSRLTPGDAGSGSPSLSADGDWIAFASAATNLVPGVQDLNGAQDVFLYARPTGRTRLVSQRAP